jgi:hypothetical protein
VSVNIHFEGIPDDLKRLSRWVNWAYRERKGKATKVPLDPRTGTEASCSDPATWGTFEEALATLRRGSVDGIGFQLGPPFVGIDLDKCRNPDTGSIQPWAREVVDVISSYSEVSPTGCGVHIWAKGSLPAGRRRRGQIEMYNGGRYLTLTGDHLFGTPKGIEERSKELKSVHGRYLFRQEPAVARDGKPLPSDTELIERARRAKNGAKFARLWEGDFSDFESASEGDLALCAILAFWTARDVAKIDKLFRRSGLYRGKWDERHGADGRTYGQLTIDTAVEHTSEVWNRSARFKRQNTTPRQQVAENKTSSKASTALPEVDAGDHDLARVSTSALAALLIANDPPKLFRYGGLPTRIESDDSQLPVVHALNQDRMRYELARRMRWQNDRGPALPPTYVVRDILATPDLPLPVLSRIVGAPVIAPDGSLHIEAGYSPTSRCFYHPAQDFSLRPIADSPTPEHVSQARDLIMELVWDFPFVSDAERAHAIGLLLLPFVRDLIDGPTPLHLIEKPSPGTGASLLASVLTHPAIGFDLPVMTEGTSEADWRKRITAKLREGPSIVLLDNLKGRLDSAALSAAITSRAWEDRILGLSEVLRCPVRCVWLATGNNPRLSNELARRTVRIRLDAKMERPFERHNFRHEGLFAWTRDHRGDLIWAALVLARAWLAAERPSGQRSLGMFESWARTVGGILNLAAIPGFLENTSQLYETADEEGALWRALFSAWWEKYGETPVGVTDLFELAGDFDLGSGTERSQKTRLGKLLRQVRDRQFGKLRILAAGTYQGAQIWRLAQVEEPNQSRSRD